MEIHPLGDSALLFVWPDGMAVQPAAVAEAADRIRNLHEPGVTELVPAYRSLAVHLEWQQLATCRNAEELYEAVNRLAERLLLAVESEEVAAERNTPRRVLIRVVYGGADGPDLEACASCSGMTAEQFVQSHASVEYEVAMIGFAPGFPYLAGLPEPLSQPRHSSPRMKVPAGSVGIAGNQTGVYPMESPGGWQLIGRTNAPLFRPDSAEPFLLAQGDRLSFVPVDRLDADAGSPPEAVMPSTSVHGKAGGHEGIAFEMVKPGMLTTIQDMGRKGWQAYGVSKGGAMDEEAARTANALVGNAGDEAVLEMTVIGPVLQLERDLLSAFCGADMEARLDGSVLPMNRPVWLRAGSTLSFGRAKYGCRSYMAVAGGIATPLVLGSRSTDLLARMGGLDGRALSAGDRLPAGQLSHQSRWMAEFLRAKADDGRRPWASVAWMANTASSRLLDDAVRILRVNPGAEWETFAPEQRRHLLEGTYRVEASSDRMGIRLSGTPVLRERSLELASHGVVPGTVQLPPDGLPIVLAAGCQPTGGYPKIAQVIGVDHPLLAQCRPGDRIGFRLVGLAEAWEARLQAERGFRVMQAGIRQKGALRS